MEYNSKREKLIIPEYGRNVQKMIEYTVGIEDPEKRLKSAEVIIGIMAQLNPAVKENSDYLHTLWDHMYIISKFRLVVDSPFPPPSPEELEKKPDKIPYSNRNIKFRHYGRNISEIIDKAIEFEEGEEKDALITTIANHLKKSYLNWNRESVTDETIAHHLKEMSKGQLSLDEDARLTATGEILARNKPKKKKYQSRQKDGNGKRKGYIPKSF
jgi:hypothetical protein